MLLYSIVMHIVNICKSISVRIIGTIRSIWSVGIDALFPRPEEELALKRLSPTKALETLPCAPVAPIAGMSAVFAYQDPTVKRLIWSLKYAKSSHAADIGGYALWQTIAMHKGAATIVPLPISDRRRRERGFNQTELLAQAILRHASRDSPDSCVIATNLLARATHSSRQTLKGRAERIESAADIFIAQPERAAIPFDAHIIIIDDVITTGSTMRSAIETLKKAGYTDVTGLSLAH